MILGENIRERRGDRLQQGALAHEVDVRVDREPGGGQHALGRDHVGTVQAETFRRA